MSFEPASSHANNALAWYELGLAQHQNKKVDEAIQSLRKSVTLQPRSKKAVFALGEVLELAHDRYDARALYSSSIQKLGDRPELNRKLCWLNFQDYFFAETNKRCTKAVKQNNRDVASWTLLARALYDHQEREKSLKLLGQIIKRFPKEPLPYRARGLIYFQEKSYEQAVNDLGKAFGLDVDDEEGGLYLARGLFELGNYEQALPVYMELCHLNRNFRFEFLSKQRELQRRNKTALAVQYQEAVDRI